MGPAYHKESFLIQFWATKKKTSRILEPWSFWSKQLKRWPFFRNEEAMDLYGIYGDEKIPLFHLGWNYVYARWAPKKLSYKWGEMGPLEVGWVHNPVKPIYF